nr:MAG TPA: hypothetical protein [Caudoviricetes sp.]
MLKSNATRIVSSGSRYLPRPYLTLRATTSYSLGLCTNSPPCSALSLLVLSAWLVS